MLGMSHSSIPACPPSGFVCAEPPLPADVPRDAPSRLQHRNVYVSGLSANLRAADFREMCQRFGRVEASKLCVDSNCQPTKGYGFALFFDEAAAAACIAALHGRVLDGRTLQARLADATATPAPLDPGSAHPPLARPRQGKAHPKAHPPPLTPSSQDVTPSVTPPQRALLGGTPPLVYHPAMEPVGYVPLQAPFVQPQVMGVPVYFTLPPSAATAQSAQVMLPTVMQNSAYQTPFFSPVMFPSQ